MKYDFTGKERDDETSYDYFGARYYDSRIANWTSIDPLFEKHFNYSPYNYVLRNPVYFIDPDGAQESAVLKLTYEIAKQSTKTVAPLLGISFGPLGIIANFVLSPQEFGHSTLTDRKVFVTGAEGELESIIPTGEIVISELKNEKYTPNQIKTMIEKGQSPNSVDRLDKGDPDHNEQPHIHFKGKKNKTHALNKDGTWKHGGRKLTNQEKKFLEKIGWKKPKE